MKTEGGKESSDKDWRDYFEFEKQKYCDDKRRRKYVEQRRKEQNRKDLIRTSCEKTLASYERFIEDIERKEAERKRPRTQKANRGKNLRHNGNSLALSELIVDAASTPPAAAKQQGQERTAYLSAAGREILADRPIPISAEHRDMLSAPVSQPIALPPPRIPTKDNDNVIVVGAWAVRLVVGGLVTWTWHKQLVETEKKVPKVERRHPR